MNDNLHRILIKGGVTSPGELKDIIGMLEANGMQKIYFGSRQDLLFQLHSDKQSKVRNSATFNTDIISDRSFQNIVTSYVSADIFEMTHWLKGSTYLYILEGFDFLPKLKINITDPKQRLVPLFNGNLNFIASESEDYWHLNVKLPLWTEASHYPVLIYTWDIVKIAKKIEEIFKDIQDIDELFFVLNKNLDTNNKTIEKKLETPYLTFPYYEGMNRMGLDQYWLGLYWRNNQYDLSFLKELCSFCLDNRIGKICITPWKSLIIKGIVKECRPDLERLLGRWGINIRHSQLEMNWHLPVNDNDALELKNYLVRSFDQKDISTYGLTFGISNDVGKRSHFASIVIEKNKAPSLIKDFEIRPTFNVIHFENFDPNSGKYINYAQDVDQIELPILLMELSKKYFNEIGRLPLLNDEIEKIQESMTETLHQCSSCLTVYDKKYGDEKAGIAPGTDFEDLPESYSCAVCESAKTNFVISDIILS